MTSEDLEPLVRRAARGFCERHAPALVALQSERIPRPSEQLLEEMAMLGWLDASSEEDHGVVLVALAHEVGAHSPALAVRLLVHHFCLACLPRDLIVQGQWLALDATCTDRRFAPGLRADGTDSIHPRGTLSLVLGGEIAGAWLAPIEVGGRWGLALLSREQAFGCQPVGLLGLHGLGAVEAEFLGTSAARLIAEADAAVARVTRAWRVIAPAYIAVYSAILEGTRRIASEHAETRKQNGRPLDRIPAVRDQLDCIERAVALARVASTTRPTTSDSLRLVSEVVKAALAATDAGLQVFGGAGYIVGNHIERLWRDARQLAQVLRLQEFE